MRLLVTVGTYKFDDLVLEVVNNIDRLVTIYKMITIQTGVSKLKYKNTRNIKIIQFLDKREYAKYDVILGHCGTGIILESLQRKQKVITVCNELLKDNHQKETAEMFSEYVYNLELCDVIKFLQKGVFEKRKEYIENNNTKFWESIL